MKHVLLIFLSILFVRRGSAQNEQQEINAIKSDLKFLYATGTSTTNAEEASANAKELLTLEVEQWLRVNATDEVAGFVAKSWDKISQIQTRRGRLFRAFVFIRKKDVLPYFKEEEIKMVRLSGKEEQNNEIEENKAVSVPERQTVVVDLGAALDKVEHTALPVIVEESSPTYVLSGKEKEMIAIKTFTQLNDYIKKGKESGNILAAGKYLTMPRTGTIYSFVYNKAGEVPACLKMQNGDGINLLTGKLDDISTYKGCGAIWIQTK